MRKRPSPGSGSAGTSLAAQQGEAADGAAGGAAGGAAVCYKKAADELDLLLELAGEDLGAAAGADTAAAGEGRAEARAERQQVVEGQAAAAAAAAAQRAVEEQALEGDGTPDTAGRAARSLRMQSAVSSARNYTSVLRAWLAWKRQYHAHRATGVPTIPAPPLALALAPALCCLAVWCCLICPHLLAASFSFSLPEIGML